jgi:hypothetical protein
MKLETGNWRLVAMLLLGLAGASFAGTVYWTAPRRITVPQPVVVSYYRGDTVCWYFNKTNALGDFLAVDGVSAFTNYPNAATGPVQTNFVPGNYTGMSVRLDGVDDYLKGPRRILWGQTNLTMCVWTWSTAYTRSVLPYSEADSAGQYQTGFQMASLTTQLIGRVVGTSNGTKAVTNTVRNQLGLPMSTGVWHCVILTWHNQAIPNLYVDGVEVNTQLEWTAGLVTTGAASA